MGEAFHPDAFPKEFVAFQDRNFRATLFLQLLGGGQEASSSWYLSIRLFLSDVTDRCYCAGCIAPCWFRGTRGSLCDPRTHGLGSGSPLEAVHPRKRRVSRIAHAVATSVPMTALFRVRRWLAWTVRDYPFPRGSRIHSTRLWAVLVSLFLCTLQRVPWSSTDADKPESGQVFPQTGNGV